MSIKGWRGERVRLVPPDRRVHLENALRWMNDPDVTGTIAVSLGVARGQEEAFFDRIERGSDSEFHWAIVAEDDNDRHIGFIDLRGIHWQFRSASGGLLIGD